MSQIDIHAVRRDEFGKGPSRRLRAAGRVPAVIYGTSTAVVPVSVLAHDLEQSLRVAEVILKIDVGGDSFTVAPRQVQRDPVSRTIEHVDFVVLSRREARERLVVGQAVQAAEAAAAEFELEPVAVVTALHELLDEGLEPEAAVPAAVERVREQVAAQAAAAAAAAAAEDAAEAEAGIAGEGEVEPSSDAAGSAGS